jgi:hypothetical protein
VNVTVRGDAPERGVAEKETEGEGVPPFERVKMSPLEGSPGIPNPVVQSLSERNAVVVEFGDQTKYASFPTSEVADTIPE